MNPMKQLPRRSFLIASAALATTAPGLDFARAEEQLNPDEGVTAPEDLMKSPAF
jgi:hypothetical protein